MSGAAWRSLARGLARGAAGAARLRRRRGVGAGAAAARAAVARRAEADRAVDALRGARRAEVVDGALDRAQVGAVAGALSAALGAEAEVAARGGQQPRRRRRRHDARRAHLELGLEFRQRERLNTINQYSVFDRDRIKPTAPSRSTSRRSILFPLALS